MSPPSTKHLDWHEHDQQRHGRKGGHAQLHVQQGQGDQNSHRAGKRYWAREYVVQVSVIINQAPIPPSRIQPPHTINRAHLPMRLRMDWQSIWMVSTSEPMAE